MAIALESNSFKFTFPSSLRRPLPHKPFLIPCRPPEPTRSLTLKAQRFSKFKDSNEHSTVSSNLTPSQKDSPAPSQKDSHFQATVDAVDSAMVEAGKALLNPAVIIVMVTAVMLCRYAPTFVMNNVNLKIGVPVAYFTLNTFWILLLITFSAIAFLLALLFVASIFLLFRAIINIIGIALPYVLRETIRYLSQPVQCFVSPSSLIRTSVLKLQVGLLDKGNSLQEDFKSIAKAADSSTFLLTETLLALLRRLDCCISGYSCVDVKHIMEDSEKHFNRLSIEERGKFDDDALVNVNGTKKKSTISQRASEFSHEYIVITILVAAEGVHKLPAINGSGDLKEALETLGSIPTNKIHAIEVLRAPQKENDTLTEQELLEYYPTLRPF